MNVDLTAFLKELLVLNRAEGGEKKVKFYVLLGRLMLRPFQGFFWGSGRTPESRRECERKARRYWTCIMVLGLESGMQTKAHRMWNGRLKTEDRSNGGKDCERKTKIKFYMK